MTCRVAIIGLGMVARLHIQAVNSLSGFQVYGLFSRDESKTQDFAEKYAKGAKIFKHFDELCDDEYRVFVSASGSWHRYGNTTGTNRAQRTEFNSKMLGAPV